MQNESMASFVHLGISPCPSLLTELQSSFITSRASWRMAINFLLFCCCCCIDDVFPRGKATELVRGIDIEGRCANGPMSKVVLDVRRSLEHLLFIVELKKESEQWKEGIWSTSWNKNPHESEYISSKRKGHRRQLERKQRKKKVGIFEQQQQPRSKVNFIVHGTMTAIFNKAWNVRCKWPSRT